MNTIVKSSNGITLVPMETKLLAERKIFIEGKITGESADQFYQKILLLNMEDAERPVDVFLNSRGGEVAAGLEMLDAMEASEAPVRLFCISEAFSIAGVLFACGSHGRCMYPHARIMLHEPFMDHAEGGNSASMKLAADQLMDTRQILIGLLAKHTGKMQKAIGKAISYDHFFSAEESLAFGLCDTIGTFGRDQ